MPRPIPAGITVGIIEPKDAVAAFQRRRLLQPSFRWQDVFNEEHGAAFAVAGVSRLDVLKLFQDELNTLLANGGTLKQFRDAVRPSLRKKGFWGDVEVTDPSTGEKRITRFDNRRLKTIFDVNVRQSHAAGRWARIERTKDKLPYILYRTMGDERVRASHKPWDWICLPVDHPWWRTHYPPNGWGCRCKAFAVSQADIDRRIARGERIKFDPPDQPDITYVNPSTGEVTTVPYGIDPGFAYNPGIERAAQVHAVVLRKALQASPLAGAVAAAQAAADHPAMLAATGRALADWVSQILARPTPAGERYLVGSLPRSTVRAGRSLGINPGAVVALRDIELPALMRTLPAAQLPNLPALMANPTAVLVKRSARQARDLVMVLTLPAADGTTSTLYLQLRRPLLSAGPYVIVSASTTRPAQLGDAAVYVVLSGSLPQ